MIDLVNPVKVFSYKLNKVQSPSRYIGGEYGSIIKEHTENDNLYNVAVSFPDLYEIGMSNQAIKIIYNGLNAYENIRCERVFAPDIDFENLLKSENIPLYTLETGMPLCKTDLVAFSIGYELCATEILAILDDGKIPLLAKDRLDSDPIVIAGGCGITNPAPLSSFFDAIMIGEAENNLFELVKNLAEKKKIGFSRKQLLDYISQQPFMWTSESTHVSYRAIQNDFGLVPSIPTWYPQPTIKPVQDHGVVEIMRGCPNGCRFCHAGIYYRPTRIKALNLIIDEIDHLVFDAGYREISLNSLSSADFPDIAGLLDILNNRYKGYNISFQLPSLKVNSFSLPILEKLSSVRKSGLTFAVETPEEAWQLSLNKEVYAQHLVDIIKQAKNMGWSSAKFYFMIGLPVNESTKTEEETIVDFLLDLQQQTRIQCNVNIGVFIPKPHTPYQWVKQLTPKEAKKKIDYIYSKLPRGKFKLNRQNFDLTILEGLLSRGNKNVGNIILQAYKKGSRFDAWDDYLRKNMKFWTEAFEQADFNVYNWIYRDWNIDEKLPWDNVSLGPSKEFYKKEWQKSINNMLTPKCEASCSHPCGICNKKNDVKVYKIHDIEGKNNLYNIKKIPKPVKHEECNIPILYRVIFYFTRIKGGEFTAYLSQVETFHKAMLRSNLPFSFTAGFNPLPRIEFVTAMSLGVKSLEEVATCYLYEPYSENQFIEKMNKVLPQYYNITNAYIFPVTNLRKRESLSQNLFGGLYQYDFYNSKEKKIFLNSIEYKKLQNECNYEFVENNESTIHIKAVQSDKKMRIALENLFEKPWYEIAEIKKLQTLATQKISGWTAIDEENWRKNNTSFKKDTSIENTVSNESISYMELYKRIAKINKDLIDKKNELDVEKEHLFKSINKNIFW